MEVIPELMANEKTEKEIRETENVTILPGENENSQVQNKDGTDPGEEKTIILKKKDGPVFPVPSWNPVPEQNLKSAREENRAADSDPAVEGGSKENISPQEAAAPQADTEPQKAAVPQADTEPQQDAAPQADTEPEQDTTPQAAGEPQQDTVPQADAAPQQGPAAQNGAGRQQNANLQNPHPQQNSQQKQNVFPQQNSQQTQNVFPQQNRVVPQDTAGSGGGGTGRIAFLISMLLIIAVLVGLYTFGYKYCETHFMPGTQINGYDCSRLTEEEAEAKFAEAANDYVINVRFRGGTTEIVHAGDMGFAYKSDGSIAALLQQQDSLFWPKYFFEDSVYEIKPGGTYDDEKLTQALSSLPELQEENMEKPQDAYIQFKDGNEEEDGEFVIIPETQGSTIDIVQLEAGVGDAAARYADMIDAEEISGAYVEAAIKSDDAKIIARRDDLNDLVGASITYELPSGETMRLNSDVTKDWLVKDDGGKLVKDEKVWDEKLWEFLDQLAYNTNTIGMDRQFQSTLRGQITVSGGDYGYMVNQVTEHDKLVEDFEKKTKETREPDYYITPYNDQTENDGIGTTYIEADLSAQHFWCYVDGQLMVESDFVSGDTTTGHGTPTGVFGIMFMLKDTTLRGVMQSNGKYEYETKVGYWMPFYDGCGFHDAWWRTAFGGSIYQGNGSHGCINLPVDAAQALYSYCENKMPVVVYW
jgi:hypothetical protein